MFSLVNTGMNICVDKTYLDCCSLLLEDLHMKGSRMKNPEVRQMVAIHIKEAGLNF